MFYYTLSFENQSTEIEIEQNSTICYKILWKWKAKILYPIWLNIKQHLTKAFGDIVLLISWEMKPYN